MRFKKIILLHDQYQAYCRFMLKYEISSFRIACIVGCVHTLLFLAIDYWRVEHYLVDVIFRTAMIVVLIGVIRISYSDRITVMGHNSLCLFTCSAILALSFIMDMTSGMPVFFIPNFICLLFYVFNAGLGHSIKLKSIHTSLSLVVFILYSLYLSPHRSSHLSQSFNIFLNATISLMIGFLIERYKRINFIQRKKIEVLNETKTRLIAIFSHDIGSPLNSLNGLLQLKEGGMLSEDELNQHSRKVKKALENVLDMLKNIVKWSRLQLEGFNPIMEKTNIGIVINEVIESVSNMAEQKKIGIQNRLTSEAHVTLDPEILKLVIRNFLTNSIKFSHPNSFVTISSSVQADSITISVQDTGTGISAENISKLFGFKNSTVGTQDEKGSGIGLAITKEFTEMMNGKISVKSEIGNGSTFSVTFPLTP